MLSHVNLLSTKSIIIKIQKRGFIKPLFRLGGDEGTRSRIFLAPSRKKFLDPGSRFRVLAKHRSAFLIPTEAKQLASFVSRKKPKIRSDEPTGFVVLAEKTGHTRERFHPENPDGIDGELGYFKTDD